LNFLPWLAAVAVELKDLPMAAVAVVEELAVCW
jgi:hypothetical protein